MSSEYHPDWCAGSACTAYVEGGDELHRSDPIMVTTDDPNIELYVFKTANLDGTGEYIEMVKLNVPAGRPWHLSDPVLGTELVLPMTSAPAVLRAVAILS